MNVWSSEAIKTWIEILHVCVGSKIGLHTFNGLKVKMLDQEKLQYRALEGSLDTYDTAQGLCRKCIFLPDPRGAGLDEAFQISSVRTSVRPSVRTSPH